MKLAEEIKKSYSCFDYCHEFDIPIDSHGRGYSLEKGQNRTCLYVTDTWWYDFKLDKGGDVISLCASHKFDDDNGKALLFLADHLGYQTSEKPQEWKDYMQNLGNKIAYWHECLEDEHYQYFYSRGLTKEYVDKTMLGFDPIAKRIVIPYWNHGGYYPYYCTRAWLKDDKAKYKKMKIDEFNENIIWGLQTLKEDNELLVLAEGAFDAMSWAQEGYQVLSPITGHFKSDTQLPHFLDIAKRYKKVLVIFDNDNAGNGFTFKMAKILFSHHIEFVVGHIPHQYGKDVSDYYSKGQNLENIIKNASNGIYELANAFEDKDEFRSFIYESSRYIAKEDVIELFEHLNESRFSKEWLKQVKKNALACPTEDYVCREVLKKHNLKFHEGVGFYEYERNHWVLKADTQIMSEIGEIYGTWKSGNKLKTTLTSLKTFCFDDNEFDKKHLMCFLNGTLDLETFKFRKSTPDDLCTIQLNFCYNSKAWSEPWNTFISQICNSDETRISLLQEMCGYILFPDCRFQTAFMLIGEGENGKSLFIKLIEKVFGAKNISNVSLSELTNPFQLIQLQNSLINIGSETSTKINGAEEIMKKIVAGDTVNACHKNKPYVNFEPRAKNIFLLNNMIQTRDNSYGFARRLSFILFENRFCDNPKGENEYQKDPELLQKLEKDLSGIFNWCLIGYQILKSTKKLTKTVDDDIYKEEMKLTSNTVYEFYVEMAPFEQITNKALYELYVDFCIEAGHRGYKNRVTFFKEFRRVSQGDYEPTKLRVGADVVKGYKKCLEN